MFGLLREAKRRYLVPSPELGSSPSASLRLVSVVTTRFTNNDVIGYGPSVLLRQLLRLHLCLRPTPMGSTISMTMTKRLSIYDTNIHSHNHR